MLFILQTKCGGKCVVSEVSFDRKNGEFICRNDQGKTTLALERAIIKSITYHLIEVEGLKRSGEKHQLITVWLRHVKTITEGDTNDQ